MRLAKASALRGQAFEHSGLEQRLVEKRVEAFVQQSQALVIEHGSRRGDDDHPVFVLATPSALRCQILTRRLGRYLVDVRHLPGPSL